MVNDGTNYVCCEQLLNNVGAKCIIAANTAIKLGETICTD